MCVASAPRSLERTPEPEIVSSASRTTTARTMGDGIDRETAPSVAPASGPGGAGCSNTIGSFAMRPSSRTPPSAVARTASAPTKP